MIPVILIDAKTDRSAALQQLLRGTGSLRVMVSPTPEVTFSRSLAESGAVIIAVHEEGQDGLSFLSSIRDHGMDLPVIILASTFDQKVFTDTITRRAEFMVMDGPADTWYPVLASLIDKVSTFRRVADKVAFLEKKLNLVGSVTRHDVLNQLTAVSGYAELLEMVISDPQQKSYIEKERNALEKIRRQFQFAKDYQNLGTEPPRWQQVSSAVRRGTENVTLNGVKIEDTSGAASVFADIALEKVFFQLLDNAIRHGGHVTRIRITAGAEGDGGILVIEDDGTGIPKENKERIFGRGFGKRTGWGLFFVREVLLLTGLSITETGEPGKGARFEIRVPAESFRKEDR